MSSSTSLSPDHDADIFLTVMNGLLSGKAFVKVGGGGGGDLSSAEGRRGLVSGTDCCAFSLWIAGAAAVAGCTDGGKVISSCYVVRSHSLAMLVGVLFKPLGLIKNN